VKRALIIPGYKKGPFTPQMRRVARTLHKNGVDASIARVNWRGRTLTEWLQGMEAVLRNIDLSDTALIGFSHGAMIATLVASSQTPDHLILCSLPDF
jgi:predicted esterase